MNIASNQARLITPDCLCSLHCVLFDKFKSTPDSVSRSSIAREQYEDKNDLAAILVVASIVSGALPISTDEAREQRPPMREERTWRPITKS